MPPQRQTLGVRIRSAFFFFEAYGDHRDLHSFPTRRSSDLNQANFYYGHLENNVLQIAAERGLLCLAAFFWFILELYASLLDMLRTAPQDTHWLVLSAIASLSGFIVSGFFSYNFGDSEILLLLL